MIWSKTQEESIKYAEKTAKAIKRAGTKEGRSSSCGKSAESPVFRRETQAERSMTT
jgi:hypothetical protein